MKTRTLKPVLWERHFRMWENERGFVAWHDGSKSRRQAQLSGEEIITGECLLLGDIASDSLRAARNPPRASGFIVTKLAAKRWQVMVAP